MADHVAEIGIAELEAPMRLALDSGAAAPSFQDRCDVREFNRCEIGRDAYPASSHETVGVGAVVVASTWLAFYVFAAVHALAGF